MSAPKGKDVLPPKDQVYSSIEGLDPALRADHDQPRLRRAQGRSLRLHRIRQRRAGLLHRQSAGDNVPWRVPHAARRATSTIRCFPKMIEGHMISDVVAVLGSINVIAAELDR